MQAFLRFGKKTGIDFPITGNHWIRKTISDWYKMVYGNKLLIDFSPGTGVIAINHEPYAIKFPRVYGTVSVNPFDWIEDITDAMLSSIPQEMWRPVGEAILTQFYSFQHIEHLPRKCSDDLSSAVGHILSQKRNCGLSKWASQQSLEKTLKHFISNKGGSYKKIHDLEKLHRKAVELGLPPLSVDLVSIVECSPSARYAETGENEEYSLQVAIEAFNASLFGIGCIARSMFNLPEPKIRTSIRYYPE